MRALSRSPRFVLVVLATLTLGIGANVAAFSLVDAVLLRPLPFGSRSDRVVTLHSVYEQQVRALGGVSYPDLLDLQARLRSFEGVAGLVRVNFTLSTGARSRSAGRLLCHAGAPSNVGRCAHPRASLHCRGRGTSRPGNDGHAHARALAEPV